LTTGGVRYSFDLFSVPPDEYLAACGGVGGFVVGAGPTDCATTLPTKVKI